MTLKQELTSHMISVMQAWMDGKEIEYRLSSFYPDWRATDTPAWNWADAEYRIKRKTPGQIAWEAFQKHLVEWDQLLDEDRDAWESSAAAVIEDYKSRELSPHCRGAD